MLCLRVVESLNPGKAPGKGVLGCRKVDPKIAGRSDSDDCGVSILPPRRCPVRDKYRQTCVETSLYYHVLRRGGNIGGLVRAARRDIDGLPVCTMRLGNCRGTAARRGLRRGARTSCSMS